MPIFGRLKGIKAIFSRPQSIHGLILSCNPTEGWDSSFRNMTYSEFIDIAEKSKEFFIDKNNKNFIIENFNSCVLFYSALAKHSLEAAYFQIGLSVDDRVKLEIKAESYQQISEYIESFNAHKERIAMLIDAWRSNKRLCYEYGYKTDGYKNLCDTKEFQDKIDCNLFKSLY